MNPGALAVRCDVDGDRAITGQRAEHKYTLPLDEVVPFLRRVSAHLTPHRFVGEGENRLPGAAHFSTTIYFDTAAGTHVRAARADALHNVKVRAREYYDVHPALAEVATSRGQLLRQSAWLWFELKVRDGDTSTKHRVRLRAREVPAFLAGQHPAFARALDPAHEPDLAALVAHCRALPGPLHASCLVNYRRLAFQDAAAALRVTVDLDLAFFAPPPDLFGAGRSLVRASLGAPVCEEPHALLELKTLSALPAWLTDGLASASPARQYSKFARAAEVVHGLR